MNSSSMRFAMWSAPAMGLLFVAIAAGQREQAPVPIGGLAAGGAQPASAVIQGFTELVTVSKRRDAVWLYSLQTGHWHKQVIPEGQGPVIPTVGMGVAAFRTRTMVFACSSLTGAWDSVDLGDAPGVPIVGKDMAALRAGDMLYAFSSETGAWDSVALEEGTAGNLSLGAVALFEAGSKIYAFSPKTGHWAVVDRDDP